uniref:serine/threonine-protein kinase n=1 Tax=Trebonia sp. TaxID=2767075 RepID=UPI0026185BEA
MPGLGTLRGKIGPYRLVEKIGEGGMGVVYLARDAENRPVAVKVLGPAVSGDPIARQRLSREVETMRRVRSPYVARVLDADVGGPSPYIVTEYVRGRTLEEIVRKDGALRGDPLARLGAGLAAALAAIHAAGVVHRDLKPANVMLAGGHPVVIDFGIAHVPDATQLTQTGVVIGTPGYLAPEVIEGQPSSGASDVHSWGATMVFAATGRNPYGTGTYQTIFFRVLQGAAELDGVPAALLPLVTAALAVDPRTRPPAQWLAERCARLGPDAAGNPADSGPAGTRL